MIILSFLAGVIIYLITKNELFNFFEIPEKHVIVPLIFVLIFIIGLIGAITFYNMEIINRASNAEQEYSIYFCLTQSQGDCQALASAATNKSYARYLDGKSSKIFVSIPQSIPYQTQRNLGSPFFLGLIIGWAVGVVFSERKS